MKGYKLTDENLRTKNSYQWTIGEWQEANGEKLCEEGTLHYYDSPELAALMCPCHISYDNKIRCFEAEIEGKTITDGTKSGLLKGKMRIVKEIDMPAPTTEQRIYFAIKAAQLVLSPGTIPQFDKWADKWLSGEDRSSSAAYAAAYAAYDAAYAAYDAAYAAYAAAYASYAAHAAAYASYAAHAAYDAAYDAAYAAYDAAYAAAYASYAAHADGAKILLLSELAKEAINWKR